MITRNKECVGVLAVTNGEQALCECKPWPMKNKNCMDVRCDKWKTSIVCGLYRNLKTI